MYYLQLCYIYRPSHDQGGLPPRADCIQGCLHLGKGLPTWGGGQTPLARDTWDTTGYRQQAGGTHPTGMYSSSQIRRNSASQKEENLEYCSLKSTATTKSMKPNHIRKRQRY